LPVSLRLDEVTFSEEFLPFVNARGVEVCSLRIVCETSHFVPPLVRLSESEAASFGEESVQLLEGCTYEFEFDKPGFQIEQSNALIKKSNVGGGDGISRGRISTGNRTGILTLRVNDGIKTVASAAVEVRSSKVEYRSDYRKMLDDISEAALDLVFSLGGSTSGRLKIDSDVDTGSLQQRFFFIRSLLDSSEFEEAVSMVISRPHSRLETINETRSISQGLDPGAESLRQIGRGQPRIKCPASHPLAARFGASFSLPAQIHRRSAEETFDTPENRFVKYILDEFCSVFGDVVRVLEKRKNGKEFIRREIDPIYRKLEHYRSASVFRQLEGLKSIPLGSPVLQRRAGYREILKFWIKSQYSLSLAWSGGDDVYAGGIRDVAKLYEYWVFFLLLGVVKRLVKQDAIVLSDGLLKEVAGGFGLQLRSGQLFETSGLPLEVGGKEFRLQFSYNRKFSETKTSTQSLRLDYETSFPKAGSWSRSMQPDYTISVWPCEMLVEQAELSGKICHVHFDAKYRLNSLADAFGGSEEIEGNDDESQSDLDFVLSNTEKKTRKDYKRVDLLKMHAYKDSIRRSHGAYIIYPGVVGVDDSYRAWMAYHEVLPGIGAFCLRPDETAQASAEIIMKFMLDVLDAHADPKSRINSLI
jgi:predicted component of viral defense system (DUF524 family)